MASTSQGSVQEVTSGGGSFGPKAPSMPFPGSDWNYLHGSHSPASHHMALVSYQHRPRSHLSARLLGPALPQVHPCHWQECRDAPGFYLPRAWAKASNFPVYQKGPRSPTPSVWGKITDLRPPLSPGWLLGLALFCGPPGSDEQQLGKQN